MTKNEAIERAIERMNVLEDRLKRTEEILKETHDIAIAHAPILLPYLRKALTVIWGQEQLL